MKRILLFVLLLTNYCVFGQDYRCKSVLLSVSADFLNEKTRIQHLEDSTQLSSNLRLLPSDITAYDTMPFIFCQGSTMELRGSVGNSWLSFPGEYTFEWEGPNNLKASGNTLTLKNINQNTIGEYTLKANIKMNGCRDTILVEKYQILVATPTVKVSDRETCEGGSVKLESSNNNGGFIYDSFQKSKNTYNWTGPNNFSSREESPVLTNIKESGVYTLNITFSDFCVGSYQATAKVNIKKEALVNASASSICLNGEARLSASPSLSGVTGKYTWKGPNGFSKEGQQVLINNISKKDIGAYKVIAQFEGGCTNIDSSSVTLNIPAPIYNFTKIEEQCEGETMTFPQKNSWNRNYFDEGTKAIYSWTGPKGFKSDKETPSISNFDNSLAGEYKLEITFTGACEAKYNKSFFIKAADKLNLFLHLTSAKIPLGQSLSISPYAVWSNKSQYRYSWQGPDNYSSSRQSIYIENFDEKKAGKYTLTLDAPGCKEKSVVSADLILESAIEVPPLKVYTDSTQEKYCKGSTVRLVAHANPTSYTPDLSFNWTGPNGFKSHKSVAYVTDFGESKSGIYTITASNQYGSATSTINISLIKTPQIRISDTLKICEGGSGSSNYVSFIPSSYYTQSVNGIFAPSNMSQTYEWTGPNNFKSNGQYISFKNFRKSQAGEYELKVTFSGGCEGVVSKKLQVLESQPEINFSVDKLCNGNFLITPSVANQSYLNSLLEYKIFNSEKQEVRNPIQSGASNIYTVEAYLTGICTANKQTQIDLKNAKEFSINIPKTANICESKGHILYPDIVEPFHNEIIDNTFKQTFVSPNVFYSWSGPNNFTFLSSILYLYPTENSSITPGIYKLTATLSGECQGTYEAETEIIIDSERPRVDFNLVQKDNLIILENTTLSDNSSTFFWDFGNGQHSELSTPDTIAYTNPGTYTINLTASNACGTASNFRKITITKEEVEEENPEEEEPEEENQILSNEKPTELLSFTVSPNPSAGMVEISNPNKLDVQISVHSMDGKTLGTFSVDSSQATVTYDFSNYVAGVYLIKCMQKNGQVRTRKIVIHK
ncbi:PKD domain-containing protein [Emticicia soli]|uniref:PKD domain-containing protein n=1 Tax=Emticicia soli TaxID=2027878 RepID=A0ABW5J2X6_9BACT